MTPRALLIAPAFLFVLTVAFATRTYVQVMYDGQISHESLVEGMNYAVQTATTVGFGNWETPVFRSDSPRDRSAKVFSLRAWSVLYMLLGATTYALLTGVVVFIFVRRL
jgi:hypothetical protein